MTKRVEAATKAMDASKQIVRRSVNFEDDKLMRKLISKGLKYDKQWQVAYQDYCSARGVVGGDMQNHDKEFTATFIERNLAGSIDQDWAKKIIYGDQSQDGEKKDKKDKKDKKEKDKEKEKDKDKEKEKDKDKKKKDKKRKASDSSTSPERGTAGNQNSMAIVPALPAPPPMEMQMPMYGHGMPFGMGGMMGQMGGGMVGVNPMGLPILGDAGPPGMGMEMMDDHRARKRAKQDKADKGRKAEKASRAKK